VAGRALSFAHRSRYARPALVNGGVGAVVIVEGTPLAVLAFTVTNGRVAEIDVLSDPVRLARLDLSGLA
jgi:RNA polymerase sigma-70 factor (ECF subfamily)